MAKHGTPPGKRWQVLTERIQAMKALWSQDEASYHGEFVQFERVWSYPKPLTKPHPPILLGSLSSRLGRQRTVDLCDGWIPVETVIDEMLTFSFVDPDKWEDQLGGDGSPDSDKTIKSWFDGIGDDDLETPELGDLVVPNLKVT